MRCAGSVVARTDRQDCLSSTTHRGNCRAEVYRIFEQGKVLSYVRWILQRLYPIKHQDPWIVQVKFHRLSGGLLSDHNIRRFACGGPSSSPVSSGIKHLA